MLKELTRYRSFGSDRLLSQIISRLKRSPSRNEDLQELLAYDVPAHEMIHYGGAIELLIALGICTRDSEDNKLCICKRYSGVPAEEILQAIISRTLEFIFSPDIITCDKLQFDPTRKLHYLELSQFPLKFASFRNLLVALGALENCNSRLYLSDDSARIISGLYEPSINGMTPQALMKQLEKDRRNGESAEQFVMSYESKRLGPEKAASIKKVSDISVSAGYDIASFNESHDLTYNRFIEVKAIGRNGFFFSAGEMSAARQYGDHYFIYLVELEKAGDDGYEPKIIVNPSSYFEGCSDWRITTSEYHIRPMEELQ